METKVCTVCKKTLPLVEYHNSKSTKDGKGYRCRSCDKAARTAYREANHERFREVNRRKLLKYKYGITVEDYDRMLEEQGGVCKICGSNNGISPQGTKTFSVDHCHKTGKIRGLLCNRCNRCLGLFRDDINIVKRAIDYLKGEL